jgi:hypothetical protein
MPLRHYFLLSVGILVLVVAAVHSLAIPILPFALIVLFGETLLGFQVEDHKVPRLLAAIFRAPTQHDAAHSGSPLWTGHPAG